MKPSEMIAHVVDQGLAGGRGVVELASLPYGHPTLTHKLYPDVRQCRSEYRDCVRGVRERRRFPITIQALTLLLVAMVFLSGCKFAGRSPTPVRAPMPQIDVPPMPKMEEMSPSDLEEFNKLPEPTQRMLIENDNRLKLSLRQREAAISVYNEFARENNALNAKVLGLPVKEKEKPK